MAAEGNLVDLVSKLKTIPTNPESYFRPSKELPETTLESLKGLFDFVRQNDTNNVCPLKELMIDDFDDEQIWQQIQLQNGPFVAGIRKKVKELKKFDGRLMLLTQNGHESSEGQHQDIEFEDSSDDDDDDDINEKLMMPASSSEDEEGDEIMDEGPDDEDDSDEINNDKPKTNSQQKPKTNEFKGRKNNRKKGSIVDDKFFKLSEMSEYLDKMDQQFERNRDGKHDDEDEFDYFRDIGSDEEEEDENEDEDDDVNEWGNMVGNTAKLIGRKEQSQSKTVTELKYSDYFDPPDGEKQKHKQNTESDVDDDDDNMMEEENHESGDKAFVEEEADVVKDDEINNNEELENMSRYEREQVKIKKKITQLEKENLTKKPWQMSGEAGSTARPFNSLLEEDLNFDHTTAAAPPITEETTKTVEEIIKQRIKDEAWDDVERKQKPVMQPYEYKKKQPLDQEKSKLSLSQIYEQEYIKQTDTKDGPQEEKESDEHKEIKVLMTKLFTKLDALSNFHFTPKPLKPELKIVTNTPVISMEEVAPIVASDAMLLAPEETHEKEVELKADAEKTETDRKRERRNKKMNQRQKSRDQEKKRKLVTKLNPGMGNKYAKKDAMDRIEKESKSSKNVSVIKGDAKERTLKSSSAFFSRLHDEVKQQMKSKKGQSVKTKKKDVANVAKLKL